MRRANLRLGEMSRREKLTLSTESKLMGRGILLWLLGVPIPIILLLAMCSHH